MVSADSPAASKKLFPRPALLLATIGCMALAAAIALLSSRPNQLAVPLRAAPLFPKLPVIALPTPQPDRDIPQWSRGQVVRKVPVRPADKVIALTFDDGPWPRSTRQILQILRQNQIKATFFMVGAELHRYPDIGKAVLDGGHVIGNHSWDHASRPRDPVGEIQKTDAVIQHLAGYSPTLFRPPFGLLTNGMAKQAMQEKDAVLLWSADPNDWKRPGAGSIASTILRQSSPGGIVLMHDGGGDRSQTVAALPRIIKELQQRGYRFVTIPELLRLRYVAPIKPTVKKPVAVRHARAGHVRHAHR